MARRPATEVVVRLGPGTDLSRSWTWFPWTVGGRLGVVLSLIILIIVKAVRSFARLRDGSGASLEFPKNTT